VVFERIDEPVSSRKSRAMERHGVKSIESEQNDTFKQLKSLLTTRGIKKEGRAIVCGSKLVSEMLRDFPDRCEAWISSGDRLHLPRTLLRAWLVPAGTRVVQRARSVRDPHSPAPGALGALAAMEPG